MSESSEKTNETVKRRIPVELSEKELLKKAHRAATLTVEVLALDRELSEIKKERTAEIKEKEAEREACLKTIEAGKEEREMTCEVWKDFNANVVVYKHKGKEVDRRDMDESDRQQSLAVVKTAEEKKKAVSKKKITSRGTKKLSPKEKANQDLQELMKEETSKSKKKSAVDDHRSAAEPVFDEPPAS